MAQIKADEITQILREQIANYDSKVQVDEVGTVTSLGDGIARIHGLDKAMAGELLSFPHGIAGLALSLEEDSVGSVILGDYTELSEGDEVKRTGTILSVPVGEGMIGRVVNALGQPIDDKGPIASTESLPIERLAPGIIDRQPVREPMATGLKAIDSMIPIGRGQRELIIGDRQTGKTAVLLDTIINNAKNDLICIYCAIGQKRSSIAQVVQTLTEAGAMGHTVVVAASASEPAVRRRPDDTRLAPAAIGPGPVTFRPPGRTLTGNHQPGGTMIRTILSLTLAAGLLSAQDGPGRPGPEGMRRPGPAPEGMRRPGPEAMFRALGLAKDQEAAIHAALGRRRPAEQARHQAAAEKEEALRAALEEPATTETQLRTLHAAASEARLQALLEHRGLLLELNALLTPEQQAKARRIRENQRREAEAHRAVEADLGEPGGPPR